MAPVGGGEAFWAAVSFLFATAVIAADGVHADEAAYAPADQSPAPRGFGKVLYNKWYVDEVYDAVIVRPLVGMSRGLWRFVDRGLIDGAVNGSATRPARSAGSARDCRRGSSTRTRSRLCSARCCCWPSSFSERVG
jgi:NADH:ubiquinone oxidoreductase subunit 5 (subunit L)/multisubunit Na+/H+ antiporter MnhA subunit